MSSADISLLHGGGGDIDLNMSTNLPISLLRVYRGYLVFSWPKIPGQDGCGWCRGNVPYFYEICTNPHIQGITVYLNKNRINVVIKRVANFISFVLTVVLVAMEEVTDIVLVTFSFVLQLNLELSWKGVKFILFFSFLFNIRYDTQQFPRSSRRKVV